MFKLDLEKAEEPEIKLPTSAGSSKKQESSRQTSISALLTMPKPVSNSTTNSGKFLKRWEYVSLSILVSLVCMPSSGIVGSYGSSISGCFVVVVPFFKNLLYFTL